MEIFESKKRIGWIIPFREIEASIRPGDIFIPIIAPLDVMAYFRMKQAYTGDRWIIVEQLLKPKNVYAWNSSDAATYFVFRGGSKILSSARYFSFSVDP